MFDEEIDSKSYDEEYVQDEAAYTDETIHESVEMPISCEEIPVDDGSQ